LKITLLSLLLVSPIYTWDLTTPFPSCLVGDITWDPSNTLSLVTGVDTPESCQVECQAVADCAAFTWLRESNGLLAAHSCVLFSETGEDLPFGDVVSGPRECSCNVAGECVTAEHTIIEVVPDTPDIDECQNLCSANKECVAFTYLGLSHPLAMLCILLRECQELDTTCTDCTTGVPVCNTCQYEATIDGACVSCSNNSTTVSYAPPVPGLTSRMLLCDDPEDATCEKDLAILCPTGFHLCTHLEFNALNDGWDVTVPRQQSPVGEIYCKVSGGSGQYSLAHTSAEPISLSVDMGSNCGLGSSRESCPTQYGCADKQTTALCCSDSSECGDGVTQEPLEECDDGNNDDADDCLTSCTWRVPNEHGTSEHC